MLSALSRRLFPSGSIPGITTWARPKEAVYLRENRTGKTAVIGRYDPALSGPENRMRPVREGFENLGIAALENCRRTGTPWAVIDEIGYLEAGSEAYCQAIRQWMEQKRLAAAVRLQPLPFLEELLGRQDVFSVNLDQPFGELGCVIMASGLGKRFGGNKLLAPFRGKPMLAWALEATEGIFAVRTVVTRSREIEELCLRQGVPVLFHSLPYRSDTVRLGVEEMEKRNRSGCLFLPGDQPLLKRETVAAMALCGVCHPEEIWRATWKEQPGMPALFPNWTFSELKNLPRGEGGGALIRRYPERVRLFGLWDPWELKDADRPEDLTELEREGGK